MPAGKQASAPASRPHQTRRCRQCPQISWSCRQEPLQSPCSAPRRPFRLQASKHAHTCPQRLRLPVYPSPFRKFVTPSLAALETPPLGALVGFAGFATPPTTRWASALPPCALPASFVEPMTRKPVASCNVSPTEAGQATQAAARRQAPGSCADTGHWRTSGPIGRQA